MPEIPYYVRYTTSTTINDTDYIIVDNPNSDVAKKITYSDFKETLNSNYTNNFLFMGS